MKLGRHVSIAGSIDMAFDRAGSIGCTAMQIFVTNPRGWKLSRIEKESEAEFRKKMHATGIATIAHMPYLPNIASSNAETFKKSVDSLLANLKRCDALGIPYLVAHMGSHMGHGKKKGIENMADAINRAVDSRIKCKVLIENEAGHANCIGEDVKDMSEVYDAVGEKIGFCLDTCHLFAAGYDISDHEVLDRLFSDIRIEDVHAIHLNDAKLELGSHRDRHANIGLGYIGTRGFEKFLRYRSIASKIIVLETPVTAEMSEEEEISLARSLLPS